MLEKLAPAIRIYILWAFTRFATMGYLTPEDATELTKATMDFIMYGAPVLYAAWAIRDKMRSARSSEPTDKQNNE